MKFLTKSVLLICLASMALGPLQAQKSKKKTPQKKAVSTKARAAVAEKEISLKELGDTSAPKVVTITSAFKPFLKDAAKVNFTAATPVIDSSKIPVVYAIPSQNLFFAYQPAVLKPMALAVDSGYVWYNDQYLKLGAGNFSSFMGEAAFSFGDGKKALTNLRGNFMTATGSLPFQQAGKWGVDVLSIINTGTNHEWTTHPFYNTSTQYRYGFEPATLSFAKDQLLQQYNTIGLEVGLKNKVANEFGITYHPMVSYYRFTDNHDAVENNLVLKAPINKAFGRIYSFNVALGADISTTQFPMVPGSAPIKNDLYYVNPSLQFKTPNVRLHVGVQPTWNNKQFSLLPDVTVEARLSETPFLLEAGWIGYFQKNSYRSLAGTNPWIGSLDKLLNTRIREQYFGIKGSQGNHFSYQARFSLMQLENQPLFVNSSGDGKTFAVLFEPKMQAIRLHGEVSYTIQERVSLLGGVTFNQYNSLSVNTKPWGLLPLEITGSVKWKLLKDLQVKADVFAWDGNQYQDKSFQSRKADPAADLNLGLEFTVMPKLNLWLQMNNLLNNTYQRWNQYKVMGFTVMGGVVYSFR